MNSTKEDFISPGEAIKYHLDRKNWTQEDFAQIISISAKHANELIKNKKPLSLELILDISKAFSFDVQELEEFIKLYANYRLKNIESDSSNTVAQKATLYEKIPISEMIKKGWIEKSNDYTNLVNQCKHLLGIASKEINDLPAMIESQSYRLHFKKSENSNFDLNNAKIWRLVAETKASTMVVPPYNPQRLESLISNINEYTVRENGVSAFISDLNKAGVRFVYLSHLSKTYMDGAAFLTNTGPVIGLTGRYDRIDNFWFTIAHEIAHVLKHLKNNDDFFFDVVFNNNELDQQEKEANDIASNSLKGSEILQWFRSYYGYLPKEELIRCSEELKIHPSCIVGILAFNEKTSWATANRFKQAVKEEIPLNVKFG